MKIGNQTMKFGQLILTVMHEKRHGTLQNSVRDF